MSNSDKARIIREVKKAIASGNKHSGTARWYLTGKTPPENLRKLAIIELGKAVSSLSEAFTILLDENGEL